MGGLLTNHCFLCQCPDSADILCESCYDDLPFNRGACVACARPFCSASMCSKCLYKRWDFVDSTRCLLLYGYPVNHLIWAMKFEQCLSVTQYLATLLARHFCSQAGSLPDCVIPVPLHRNRLMSRGYNQSIELARPLAKKLAIKLDTSYCKRKRSTKPQLSLSFAERKRNVKDAFSVSSRTIYNHVLLVDDVVTSGSTVREVARTLHKAGTKQIDVVACARRV